MSSLSRAMGKALTAGAPMVYKAWEIETAQAEEARMREWQAGEYQKNRDQAATIHNDNMKMEERKIALTEKGVDADIRQGDARINQEGEALSLKREEQAKTLELLDEQILAAKEENTDSSDLRALRNELANLDPDDTKGLERVKDRLRSYGVAFKGDTSRTGFVTRRNQYGEEDIYFGDEDTGGLSPVVPMPRFSSMEEALTAAKTRYPNVSEAELTKRLAEKYPHLNK